MSVPTWAQGILLASLLVSQALCGVEVAYQKHHHQDNISFLGFTAKSRPFNAFTHTSAVHRPATVTASPASGVTMKATPTTLLDGQDVVVSWSGVDKPHAMDHIALYCGEPSNPLDYLDYRTVGSQLGNGTLTFSNLINMRCDYHLYYYSSAELYVGCGDSFASCVDQFKSAESCSKVVCPAHCADEKHNVWGSDIYTTDSSICTAAIHAGTIDSAKGGAVSIESAPGQDSYTGSTRHGVTTLPYGHWDSSFECKAPSFHPSGLRLLAKLIVPMRDGNTAPLHGRIAVTGNPTEMRVMWTSSVEKDDGAMVQWGVDPSALQSSSKVDKTTTYTASDLCGAPANITSAKQFMDPGFFHHALMTGLTPGKAYYYKYGSDKNGWSTVKRFRAARPANKDDGVKMVVYGDMGVGEPAAAQGTVGRVMERIESVDTVLHFGDISYAVGFGYIWEQFGRMIEPVATAVPYHVSLGNHETCSAGVGWHPDWGNMGHDSNGECAVPMLHRWHMPENGNELIWYSFDYGNVHVIQMSTEHDFSPDSDQYRWLEADLAAVDRGATPFVVLTGHRPMYTSEHGYDSDYKVSVHMQELFEGLLFKYGVDLALWGHYHSYERTCAVYQGNCTSAGTTHIVVGTAGAGLEGGSFGGKGYEWSVASSVEWGLGLITTTPTELHFQFIRNSDGAVDDEVTIPNRHADAEKDDRHSLSLRASFV